MNNMPRGFGGPPMMPMGQSDPSRMPTQPLLPATLPQAQFQMPSTLPQQPPQLSMMMAPAANPMAGMPPEASPAAPAALAQKPPTMDELKPMREATQDLTAGLNSGKSKEQETYNLIFNSGAGMPNYRTDLVSRQPAQMAMSDRRAKTNVRPAKSLTMQFLDAMARGA